MKYFVWLVGSKSPFILGLLLPAFVAAQKTDYQWALGGFNPSCTTCKYRFFYNFKTDPPSIVLRDDTISTPHFMASYSDKQGNILFLSEGLRIYEKTARQVENGFGLNPTFKEFQSYRGYPFQQSGFFLENPGDSNLLYLIHLDMDMYPVNTLQFVGKNLMVTTIDRRANNGAGKVVSKNEVLVSGFLQNAAATRHANGRDWWILVPDAALNRYHRFLLTPQGFQGPWAQDIGTKPSIIGVGSYWVMGSKFSPSGRHFLDISLPEGFSVYNFDRCTGLLDQEQRLNYVNTPKIVIGGGGGVEFSNDDRFLYITATHTHISHPAFPQVYVPYHIQYDLRNPEWRTAGDTLNYVPPGPYTYLQTKIHATFFGSATGPDGRLYITYLGGSYCTVQYPNRKGKAALFRYDNPDFKNNIYRGIPYLPNYRLGPLDGSPCDTLGLNNVPVANFRMDTPDSSDLQGKLFYDLSHHEPAWWRWDFGDGSGVSTDTSPVHTYALPGRYRVCLTVGNAYGTNTYCREVSIGTIAAGEPESGPEGLVFAPNPAHGATALYFSNATGTAQGDLLLLDALGRPTLRTPLRGQRTDLDIKGLLPGVYFAQVLRPGRPALTGKLVVTDGDVRGE